LQKKRLERCVVNAGTHSFPFGPFKVNGNTEWKFSPERILELKNLSTQTQGRELIDLSKVWENEGRLQLLPLKWWLLILLLLLVLLEAWFTQTGYAFDWRKFKVKLGNRNGQSHLPQKSKILSQEKRKNIFARTRGVPESGPPKEEQNKASNNSSDHKKEEKAQSKSIDRSARFTKAKIKKDKS